MLSRAVDSVLVFRKSDETLAERLDVKVDPLERELRFEMNN